MGDEKDDEQPFWVTRTPFIRNAAEIFRAVEDEINLREEEGTAGELEGISDILDSIAERRRARQSQSPDETSADPSDEETP